MPALPELSYDQPSVPELSRRFRCGLTIQKELSLGKNRFQFPDLPHQTVAMNHSELVFTAVFEPSKLQPQSLGCVLFTLHGKVGNVSSQLFDLRSRLVFRMHLIV